MANFKPDSLPGLCTEVVMKVLSYCNTKDLLRVGRTCKRLNVICYHCHSTWKRLCAEDFDVHLPTKGPFETYYEIHKLLYKSRLVMGAYVYGRYFEKKRLSTIPGWLWCMAALSEQPPVMKFGKTRFAQRCSGHYLQRFSHVPYGQLQRAWGVNKMEDLQGLFPRRIERGTMYYPFQGARYALIRKLNGKMHYFKFMLHKCYRARKVIDAKFILIKDKYPIKGV